MAGNGHAYVVQRTPPKKDMHYVVVVNGKDIHVADTQEAAADWAIDQGYTTHVARVRDLPDFGNPNHWRSYP